MWYNQWYNHGMSETNNDLLQLLLDDRIRGKNYLEIEQKHGIPAAEAKSMVMQALTEIAGKDPIEQRGILQLRLERIVDKLWEGLEMGSFKHGEAILKSAEKIAELMDLNQQTIKHEISIISDQETQKLTEVLKKNNQALYQRVLALELAADSQETVQQEWPQWAATASTDAIEEVIYAEEMEDVY